MLYVFRSLVDDDIPLNAGCLKPIDIIVPAHSMLSPEYPAAVVAGNVETSQCIVDTLYGALGVMAGSQGTMNNLTFGNARYQYYETICGGSGAGPDFDGTDAVHTHMTNSRLTDPEVLEWRFPVLVDDFQYSPRQRRRRRVSRRARRDPAYPVPRGDDGGDPVEPPADRALRHGRRRRRRHRTNRVERVDGRVDELGPADQAELEPGDVFVIETPGGGGYGKP